ncbi:hypothetical protein INR49_010984 [Caranx melampygus]|nr:hypothetical protein INR49_010984 [Caranx melampygus]
MCLVVRTVDVNTYHFVRKISDHEVVMSALFFLKNQPEKFLTRYKPTVKRLFHVTVTEFVRFLHCVSDNDPDFTALLYVL